MICRVIPALPLLLITPLHLASACVGIGKSTIGCVAVNSYQEPCVVGLGATAEQHRYQQDSALGKSTISCVGGFMKIRSIMFIA